MSCHNWYSMLDRPEILEFVFYPRKDFRKGPPDSTDYLIPVGDGVSICCRFYAHSQNSPSILFFHGNGEVVSDYDDIALIYNEKSINLFVADYRGYGSSGGTPTFTSMVGDAHNIFETFLDILHNGRHTGNIFVMGRSLGSICAIELGSCYQEQVKGLIVESGFASVVRLLKRLGFPAELLGIRDIAFPNLAKIRSIILPTLIIHGEYDSLIPVAEARDLFENAAAARKYLIIINGADHNSIMWVDMEKYFTTIEEFVFKESSG